MKADVNGLSVLTVVDHKSNKSLVNIKQLKIINTLELGMVSSDVDITKENNCTQCQSVKYLLSGRSPLIFRKEVFNDHVDIVKSNEVFGDDDIGDAAKGASNLKLVNGADNIASGAKLKTDLKLTEKYGTGFVKELPDGRIRYYGDVIPASKPGKMVGRRLVREWNPANDAMRTWHETLDGLGDIRQIRPDVKFTGGAKIHYRFDINGDYIGKW